MSLTLMAAAALAYPQLGDYFWATLVTRRIGDLFVEVYAGPDGKVDECEVLHSDFSAAEDERLCNVVRQRDVAVPAHDQFGRPVHGTTIFRFSTTLGREAAPIVLQREANIEVGVRSLPAAANGKLNVGLRVLVDETGRIEYCEPDSRPNDAYTRAACEQAVLHPQRIRSDRDGSPVRHVTNIAVEFVTEGAPG